MEMALYIIVAILGLIIGSFLNVVIIRLHTKRISKGRSKCLRCGHALSSRDVVPVLSFIFLFGRCRYCKSKVSWQYPLVEIITSGVFVLLFWKLSSYFMMPSFMGIVLFAFYAFLFSVLIVMAVYDIRHFILPWKLMKIFLILSFLGPFAIGILGDGVSFENIIAGFITAFPFWVIWYFSRGRLIGFGDVQLMCGFGFLLGISGGFAAILLGFWAGALFVFLKMIVTRKRMDGKTQIPFGPFLIIGLFIAFIFNVTISSFVLQLV